MLYLIKQKFRRSVKLYSGNNYLIYRLHYKAGLLNLIDKVNKLIKNLTYFNLNKTKKYLVFY